MEWMRKGENDLKTARLVMDAEDGPLDTVCFHSPQLAEKALKALLTHRQVRFSKTHSLQLLLDLLAVPDFEKYREACIILSGYAIEARYPGDSTDPEREEAEDAVKMASEIFEAISQILKSEVSS
jgi:HEPN domain-containing protein